MKYIMLLISKKPVIRSFVIVLAILFVPLILTILNPLATVWGGTGGGWDWGPLDFLVMGFLLFVTGLAVEATLSLPLSTLHKTGMVISILFILTMIWVELAVDGVSQLLLRV